MDKKLGSLVSSLKVSPNRTLTLLQCSFYPIPLLRPVIWYHELVPDHIKDPGGRQALSMAELLMRLAALWHLEVVGRIE